MTNFSEDSTDRKLAGCGMSILITGALVILGIAAAVIFVLIMFGSWIGGQS
jgi:hypothetical protein